MNTSIFNPLDYPLCLEQPERLTGVTSWHEHIPFAFALMQMLQPQVVVELGTHKGDSYCAFCQAVCMLNLCCSCTAVDTWKGDTQAGTYGLQVLEDLAAYHDSRYGGFSRLKQCRFDDALADVSPGSIDLLHIDGFHSYEAVRHDYESWLPTVSSRGLILFHDIAVHDAGFGVWQIWEEVEKSYPSFTFEHGHGLGVLGVGTELPFAVRSLLTLPERDQQAVRAYFSALGGRLRAWGDEVRTLENHLLALREEIRQCRHQTEDVAESLTTTRSELLESSDRIRKLERILNHPLVRVLRAVKKWD